MKGEKFIQLAFEKLLSNKTKHATERVILSVAIVSYIVHLLLIFLTCQGVIHLDDTFFKHPIAAIYTPFSFVLLYEVYLLIYFLPKSITIYIGKQYEIITLIVIRRIFKDIAYVELTSEWFKDQNDLQFTYDAITSLILFLLIFFFYKIIKQYLSKFSKMISIKCYSVLKAYRFSSDPDFYGKEDVVLFGETNQKITRNSTTTGFVSRDF